MMKSNKTFSERLEKLKQIPLFSSFKDDVESLKKVDSICKLKHFDKDVVVISEGDGGDELFIVFDGSVEIRKKTRSGDEYTVVLLNAEHNIFFGELGIVSDGERSATVIAKSDSTFLTITKSNLRAQ